MQVGDASAASILPACEAAGVGTSWDELGRRERASPTFIVQGGGREGGRAHVPGLGAGRGGRGAHAVDAMRCHTTPTAPATATEHCFALLCWETASLGACEKPLLFAVSRSRAYPRVSDRPPHLPPPATEAAAGGVPGVWSLESLESSRAASGRGADGGQAGGVRAGPPVVVRTVQHVLH